MDKRTKVRNGLKNGPKMDQKGQKWSFKKLLNCVFNEIWFFFKSACDFEEFWIFWPTVELCVCVCI